MGHGTSDSENRAELLVDSSQGTRFSKKIVAAVLAGATVLLAPVAIHLGQPALLRGSLDSVQNEEQFKSKMDLCADSTQNCFGNKCCKSTGYSCYQTGASTAQCALACPPGSACQVLQPWYKAKPAWTSGNSMYCYTFYQVQRGRTPELADNPKELAILKYQKSAGIGIFACDDWKVFSDKKVDIGGGVSSAPVLISPDFTKYMRKDKPDRYLNTPLYMDAWRQIKAEGRYALFSWTVKVDPATVFLPVQLKNRLADYPETPTGTYIETCNKVLMGYFGNFEVVSKTGMKRFLEQFEGYYNNGGKCWRNDTPECQKKWKYGPWGEDLFMQFCMDDAEVAKKEDFTLTDTGTCPGMRPPAEKDNKKFVPSCTDSGVYKFVAVHPLRNVSAWQDCYKAISAR